MFVCVRVRVCLCVNLRAQLPNSLARPPNLRVVNLRELGLKLLAVVGSTVERQRSVLSAHNIVETYGRLVVMEGNARG